MKSLVACIKKEFLDIYRSGKLLIIGLLFVAFGIMNPAIAKLTPWLLEIFAESLEESGMTITEVTVNALTSWIQFFKNIPMALIVFVLMFGAIFTKEYDRGTLVIILTKGLDRYKIVLSKIIVLVLLWTIGYFICYYVTYLYNDFFWDNSIVNNLTLGVINWWLFGIFVIALIVLFSVCCKTYSMVLLGTGSVVMGCYVISLIPKIKYLLPITLIQTNNLLAGIDNNKFIPTIVITSVISIISFLISIPIMTKKEI